MRARACLLIFVFLVTAAAAAQDLRPGRFLVAKPELGDPNFVRTVILLLEHGEDGAMGLILNRPTDVKAANILTGVEGLERRPETAFLGGPVQRETAMVLLQSADEPEDTKRVFEDIYVTGSRDVLQTLVQADRPVFRVFLGYSGWSAGQLELEIAHGSWSVLRGDADSIFSKDPDALWQYYTEKGSLRFAGLPPASRSDAGD